MGIYASVARVDFSDSISSFIEGLITNKCIFMAFDLIVTCEVEEYINYDVVCLQIGIENHNITLSILYHSIDYMNVSS